jgi:hypothetical protein
MRFGAALFLSSFVAFAQTPPAEVDEALRSRVNEFFGYHVTGDFEKAWGMVAEDTKKEYFSAQKSKYESFKLDNIKYSDEFTKAVVTLTVSEKRRMSPQFPETEITHPVSTFWKVENGKWCWYNDHQATWLMPMGPSAPPKTSPQGSSAPQLTPEQIKARVQGIMGQSSFNKTELHLVVGKPSQDEAVFHNGQGGQVQIGLLAPALPKGMAVKLEKNSLNANEDAVLKVTYTPTDPNAPLPSDITLNVVMEPFSRAFPLMVRFSK